MATQPFEIRDNSVRKRKDPSVYALQYKTRPLDGIGFNQISIIDEAAAKALNADNFAALNKPARDQLFVARVQTALPFQDSDIRSIKRSGSFSTSKSLR